MTDEIRPDDQPGEERSEPEQQQPAPAGAPTSIVAQMGAGERLVVLAGALMLANYIIFDLIADSYGIGSIAFVVSLGILTAAYLKYKRSDATWSVPYESVLRVLVWVLFAQGVYFFISEVRGGIFDRRAAVVIGALIFYAATVIAGVGAYQLRKTA